MVLKSKNLEVTQAVLICDNFNDEFQPIQSNQQLALLKIVNCPIIDHTLTFLKLSGIEQVIIFSSNAKKLRNYLEKRKWMKSDDEIPFAIVRSSDNLTSLGEVMREVYNNNLIKNDFILLNGNVIGGKIELNKLLKEHVHRRLNDDKGALITLLFNKLNFNHRSRNNKNDTILVLNKQTQKLLYYESLTNHNSRKKINLKLDLFNKNPNLEIHFDLQDTNIAICSFALPSLFQDNCDYDTKDDLICSILVQEEILQNTIYIKTIDDGSYGINVNDAFSFDSVSRDIIERWAFPTVPDLQEDLCYHRHNIYKSSNVDLKIDSVLEKNLVIGKNTSIDSGTRIKNSVIGENCRIGRNVRIDGCYLMDNTIVENDCILNRCILSTNVLIKEGSILKEGCILGENCIIGPNITLPPCTLLQDKSEFGDGKIDKELVGLEGKAYLYEFEETDEDDESTDGKKESKLLWCQQINQLDDSLTDDSQSLNDESNDEQIDEEEEFDEFKAFYKEVIESLTRGYKDGIECKNLILEINCSKHAYNIPIKDVVCLVIKSILDLPKIINDNLNDEKDYINYLDKFFNKFLPIFEKYVKSKETQLDCLLTLENLALDKNSLYDINSLVKNLNFLYDKDILEEDTIIEWFNNFKKLEFPSILEKFNIKERIELRSNSKVKLFIKWLEEAEEESDDE